MGGSKLLLQLPDGRRLVDLPAQALRAVCRHCLAVGQPPVHIPELTGFENLNDALPQQGPLGGMVAALEAAKTEWVLVLAADMPAVKGEFLAALQREAESDPSRALIPAGLTGLEPLCAAYPASVAPLLRDALQSGKRTAHQALDLEHRRVWPYAAVRTAAKLPEPFRNVNTPSEWELLTGEIPNLPPPPIA